MPSAYDGTRTIRFGGEYFAASTRVADGASVRRGGVCYVSRRNAAKRTSSKERHTTLPWWKESEEADLFRWTGGNKKWPANSRRRTRHWSSRLSTPFSTNATMQQRSDSGPLTTSNTALISRLVVKVCSI